MPPYQRRVFADRSRQVEGATKEDKGPRPALIFRDVVPTRFPESSGLALPGLGTQIGRHVRAGTKALAKAQAHYQSAGVMLREARKAIRQLGPHRHYATTPGAPGIDWGGWVKWAAAISPEGARALIGIGRGELILVPWDVRKAMGALYRRAEKKGDTALADKLRGATLTHRAALPPSDSGELKPRQDLRPRDRQYTLPPQLTAPLSSEDVIQRFVEVLAGCDYTDDEGDFISFYPQTRRGEGARDQYVPPKQVPSQTDDAPADDHGGDEAPPAYGALDEDDDHDH